MDEHFVILLGEIVVQLTLWNPSEVLVVCVLGDSLRETWETTPVIRMEVISPHTLQMVPCSLLSFSDSEVSHGVRLWQTSIVLDSPLVARQLDEQILLRSQESLSKEDGASGELPLLSVFVLHDEEHAVLRCVV